MRFLKSQDRLHKTWGFPTIRPKIAGTRWGVARLLGLALLLVTPLPSQAAPWIDLPGVYLADCACGTQAGGCTGRYHGRRFELYFVFRATTSFKEGPKDPLLKIFKKGRRISPVDSFCPSNPRVTHPKVRVVDLQGFWEKPGIFRVAVFTIP
ncbi:exported hypothetical protein [Candidatus Competibacter denitrificans Run_A_D11]|uniref:Uncharacterized protein n=1 Tax=Candidatus Competibacter denitrificans Run_A_D11 TaxID=1400863 RepID=W6M9M3_9GAMM|nr:exported hypothetical protein [Candidatus Competibacter denitrificans Run_A_D11]